MGACSSSSEVITDPYSGQVKVRNKLGGAPPALRRPQPPIDVPTPQINEPLHYVSYGGGNALYLMNNQGSYSNYDSPSYPMNNASEYVQVTLPPNIYPGDALRVQAPDGRMNEIIVPQGLNPGDRFNVRFTSEGPPPAFAIPVEMMNSSTTSYYAPNSYPPPLQPSYGTSNSPSTFEVTLPPNLYPGDTLHVQTPSGRIQAVIVPNGVPAGARFIVRIEAEESIASPSPVITSNNNNSYPNNTYATIPTTPPAMNSTINQFEPTIYVPSYSNTPSHNPQQVNIPGSTITPQVYVPTVYTRP